jgi:hypothetical protein
MLKKSASCVLPSKASSTGTRPPHISAARTNVVLLIRRTVRPRGYASGAFIDCGLAWDKARLGAPGVGRVRSLAFLSILYSFGLLSHWGSFRPADSSDPGRML